MDNWAVRILITLVCLAVIALLSSCARRSGPIKPSTAELRVCESVGIKATDAGIIKSAACCALQPLPELDEECNPGEPVGIQFEVPTDRADHLRETLSEKLKDRGYLAFVSEKHYGVGGQEDKIAVIRGQDQYDILRVRQTSGPNYDIDHDAVVAKLRAWQARYRFEIIGADYDWVEIEFSDAPADIQAFAKEVYGFCPDTVDQGTGTIKGLEDEISSTKRLFLWWD